MRLEQTVQYSSRSDIGLRRRNNQDSCVVQICTDREEWKNHGHLFMVADGMGGHAAGELASKMAVDTIPHTFFKSRDLSIKEALKKAIVIANNSINRRGTENPDFERMGTTCTTLVLSPRGAIVGHVGDSRCYRIREGQIDQLSFDHSLQWELIRRGKMKPEEVFMTEPRHVITRSLGPDPVVEVDVEGPYPTIPGDIYLLCSDGLTGHVQDEEIGAIVSQLPIGEACRLLINLANVRGGSDNVTVIIAKVGALPEGTPSEDEEEAITPEQRKRGIFWLVAAWILAILFVVGVSLTVLGEKLPGAISIALSVILSGALFFFWNRTRQAYSAKNNNLDETVSSKPYRSASARLTPKFLSHLAAVESELYQTIQEENWTVNQKELNDAYEKSKKGLSEKNYSVAMRQFARAIDIMMEGMNNYRKQINHDSKWKEDDSTS
ncbi:Protein serine/threonine phosphatase PrpC, regulation of stationary phase [hydrothermal vent metagenome]|uniref:Protein serine/threonine phosphatase PrpC, regulation of stationary phase n=1 Tax=hydrothermal vent metagenome TaxID=652676 RepID=A0A3B1E6P6_9ZZZZ